MLRRSLHPTAPKVTARLEIAPEPVENRFARLGARILHAAFALVWFPESEQQPAKRGVDQTERWLGPAGMMVVNRLCRHAAAARKPLIISDTRLPGLGREAYVLDASTVVAFIGIPLLMADGQVAGCFCVIDGKPRMWSEDELDIVQELSVAVTDQLELRHVAEPSQLVVAEQVDNAVLMQGYDAMLEAWVQCLDQYAKEAPDHTKTVIEVTMQLATRMGMHGADLIPLRRGALLHDIGKLGVPAPILHKPGALTTEEWEVMRCHPTYGYDLLKSMPGLGTAVDIPYCHHEKWDGTGYPRGLKSDTIPLSARIFAVVDVWDALCSYRPYRNGWPEQRVRQHIHSRAGSHFDPQVVEAFLLIK